MKSKALWISLTLAMTALPATAQETLDLRTLRKMSPSEAASAALGQVGASINQRFIWGSYPPSNVSQLSAATFYGTPKASNVGICAVNAVTVEFTPATPFQPGAPVVDDPPVRASRVTGETRFRVAGGVALSEPETEASYRKTDAACLGLQLSQTYFFIAEGSSMQAQKGVEMLDQAIAGARSKGATPYRFVCEQSEACGGSRDRLRTMRLDQIQSVRDCLSFAERAQGGYCYDVAMMPTDPNDHYQWGLRLRGGRTLSSVSLMRWMPPIA